ncbi:MAG: hypothetical protein IKM30_05025 [Oscillospiraceae bacterium]|nr:hypothetical protein [Oscillospiraceae bacterium]
MNPIYNFNQKEPPQLTEARLRLIHEQRQLRRTIRILLSCAAIMILTLVIFTAFSLYYAPLFSILPIIAILYTVVGATLIYWAFTRYGTPLLRNSKSSINHKSI